MKTTLIVTSLLIAITSSALAGKPHKANQAQPQQRTSPPPAGPLPPSVRLSQFTAAHLDHILAPVDQQVVLPRTELSQLRATLTSEWGQAPDLKKAQYQSAIAVCDALSQAMDERDKMVSSAQSSANAPTVQDTHDTRVSVPRHGRGSGKAARADAHLEANENQQHQNEAAQKSAFLSSGYAKQWADRAAIIRQRIQQLSSQQLQAEQVAAQSTAAPTISPH